MRKLIYALVFLLPVSLVVASCCLWQTHVTYPETNLRPPVPMALVRANVIHFCSAPIDCQNYVPKCADPNKIACSHGVCEFATAPNAECHCYDTERRYCDVGSAGACRPPAPLGCGVQRCVATGTGADWEDVCDPLPQTQWPCGRELDPCCGDSACYDGLICSDKQCVSCGSATQPCCGKTCDQGLTCQNGSCVACGGTGQGCCGTNCTQGLICQNGLCIACGSVGQACCGTNCSQGLTCQNGLCVACGGSDQPCCGNICSGGLICQNNICQCSSSQGQACGSCGGKLLCDGIACSVPTPPNLGQSCGCGGRGTIQCSGCVGGECPAGLACINNACARPPCPSGQTRCGNGSCCDGKCGGIPNRCCPSGNQWCGNNSCCERCWGSVCP
jgi:hypothetical protein